MLLYIYILSKHWGSGKQFNDYISWNFNTKTKLNWAYALVIYSLGFCQKDIKEVGFFFFIPPKQIYHARKDIEQSQ